MNALEKDIIEFADQNLKRDLPSRLKKFFEEAGELAEAIANGDVNAARMEAADCGIVLTDIAHLLGQAPVYPRTESLSELMEIKFSVVLERFARGEWPKQKDRP